MAEQEDRTNATTFDFNAAKHILIATTVLPSVIGVFATVLLILIHILYPEVRKPFTIMVLSVSAGDLVHFLDAIFLEPIGITQMQPNSSSFICKMAGCIIMLTLMYTILAQASLAIDRYLQIVWQRSPKIWHRWIIVCLNLVITIVTTIPQGLQDAFGGKPGVTCVVDMRKYDFAINSGSLFIMAMSYVVTLACGMRLLLFLKSYRKQNLSIRQRMNLRDNSDISNLILIQTVLAVSLQPMTIIMYVIDGIILGVPQWLRFTLIMCYYITPMLNSVILFYIIKPYRRALMKMIGRRVQPVESIAAIQNNSTLLELGGFSSVHNRLKMAN